MRQLYKYSGLIAGLGIGTLLIGLIIIIALPSMKLTAFGLLALGVVLLIAAFVFDFRRVRGALVGRRGRFGVGTTVMASIFLGIILVANSLSIANYKRFDMTALAQFSLAPQTKQVLAELNVPIKAIAFLSPNDPYGINSYILDMLNEYKTISDKITIQVIDPDERPDEARKYDVSQYQTVVFENQDKRRMVLPVEIVGEAEYAFTSALLEVTGVAQKKVYFLVGHGEADIYTSGGTGYSMVREGLKKELYQVATLNLLNTPQIPEDTAVIVIAAPQNAIPENEFNIINDYLKNGGQALILANPQSPSQIDLLLATWGFRLDAGTAIDPDSFVAPKKDMPIASAPVFNLPVTYFPGAASITSPEKLPDTIQMLPIAQTGRNSWLEKEFDPQKEPAFNQGTDLKGPLTLGVLIAAVPPNQPEGSKITRLAIIGDSDFASDQHFENGNNGDLILNSVSWLAEETELISIRHKALSFRRLVVGTEETNLITYSSIGLLPLIVLVAGGIVWWRRR